VPFLTDDLFPELGFLDHMRAVMVCSGCAVCCAFARACVQVSVREGYIFNKLYFEFCG
jgi:hypothetical protein